MPDLWMPGATRLDIGDHASTDGGPAKAVAHVTWDRNATGAKPKDLVPYERLVDYFGRNPDGRAVAPHILWDPFTGRVTQFVPANSRSKSLADVPGGTRTNRAGSVVIQVESLFFPYCQVSGKAYARLIDTPCKGWPELQAWVHSWGVPNSWPMGRPVDFTPHRSESTWEKTAGWYGHSQVPENTHQDPGTWPAFVGTPTATPPVYEPFPGASFFKTGRRSPTIAAMHKQLVAEGCNRYQSSANSDVWGSGDKASYAAWQRKLGYTGSAADGTPGFASWSKLHVPNV
jgi:hypothetical protein